MAQPTLQEVADTARLTLNDADKDRWSDTDDMLRYLRDGIGVMLDKRPDLFVGQFVSLDLSALALVSDFPINARFVPMLVDYVIFRALRKDSEFSQGGQAVASNKWFDERL